MNVLVYGSGAVGLGISASLLDCGCNVDLIASGSTKEQLCKEGLSRIGLFKEIHIPPERIQVYQNLKELNRKKYDYILICTKTITNHKNAYELSIHKELLKPYSKIIIFQNGWGNDEPYLKYFERNQVYSARVITGFSRPQRNISEVTVHASPILLGSLHHESTDCLIPLADAINDGGIPCEVTREVDKALWAKMLYNCTLNPLGAVLGVCYGKLTECENSIFIMNRIIEEIYSVMKAAGYKTYWETAEDYKKVFYEDLVPATYNHRSSTLQDIEKKIKTEIDTLNGSIIKLSKEYNIAVPYNEMIHHLIKTKESYF
jgi:2-dehydropantoate 2-reductase